MGECFWCGLIGHREVASSGAKMRNTQSNGAGGDSRATRPSLVFYPTLVGADMQTVPYLLNKIDVGAIGAQVRMVAQAASFAYHIVVGQVGYLLHIVWHTGIEPPALQHRA